MPKEETKLLEEFSKEETKEENTNQVAAQIEESKSIPTPIKYKAKPYEICEEMLDLSPLDTLTGQQRDYFLKGVEASKSMIKYFN